MRLPRDVSGNELAKKLEEYGYQITRQTGSHLRLTTLMNGEHHITIPVHKELRVGLLSTILDDIADHLGISRDDLTKALFGK
jgi:predicted RNA binding protein YcfA (HicA-like mRNA interferase family)